MLTRRSLLAAVGAWMQCAAAVAEPAGGLVGQPSQQSMIFFVAKGGPNACGPGCDQWIAAEGEFDIQTPRRLQAVLDRIGDARMPIFFLSPGGSAHAARLVGRTLRERNVTAGVARTVPRDCDNILGRGAMCDALKRRDGAVSSRLVTHKASCNSACVFALIGAPVRLVHPEARLGVHRPGLVVTRGEERLTTEHVPPVRIAVLRRSTSDYVRDMGIDEGLVDVMFSTAFTGLRYLTREEIVRFRIETRSAPVSPNWAN